jgi:hypothetical protein
VDCPSLGGVAEMYTASSIRRERFVRNESVLASEPVAVAVVAGGELPLVDFRKMFTGLQHLGGQSHRFGWPVELACRRLGGGSSSKVRPTRLLPRRRLTLRRRRRRCCRGVVARWRAHASRRAAKPHPLSRSRREGGRGRGRSRWTLSHFAVGESERVAVVAGGAACSCLGEARRWRRR